MRPDIPYTVDSPETPDGRDGPDGVDSRHGWRLPHDLDAFLDCAGEFLASRPALHTVPLTVVDSLRRRGPHVYGDDDPVFGVLGGDPPAGPGGGVRGAFFRTPPHGIYLTSLTEQEADALAATLAAAGHQLPGVSADRDTAAAFARAWQRQTGSESRVTVRQRLYRLAELTPPEPAPAGRARVAAAADRDLLVRWHEEFSAQVGGHPVQEGGAWADSRIAYGGITFWETPDGVPVAMAGATPEVAGQIRVAPVYTPAELRGRGYAGAATAEVSRAALASGAAEVLLFTDLSNPTSNGLYQRIGYRPVADFAVHEFTGPPSAADPS
ncbi:GNAT family N-acetyltransferase [Streptomyces sp. IBSBF 2953]|uniref:GNAT family N-acetyltransferase n=1 Tax=Streptomyces sp. B21-097 TaxID=3039414 RepID=UPI00211A4B7C|nr:GNAT family N-acetyltransferase [Streptomyces hayashii]